MTACAPGANSMASITTPNSWICFFIALFLLICFKGHRIYLSTGAAPLEYRPMTAAQSICFCRLR
jgi:hypothetical protein